MIISQHPYPKHATLRRNAVQLLDLGVHVDLICLAPGKSSNWRIDDPRGLTIFQLPLEHKRTNALRYVFEYMTFFIWSTAISLALSVRHRYDTVLIDNPQDFLIAIAFISRLRGSRIVLEMFELTPELAAARMGFDQKHPLIRLTRLIELVATKSADHLIVVSDRCKEILAERGVDGRKVSILPNTIPFAVVPPRSKPGPDETKFIVTHCTLVERYGVHIAIRALTLLRHQWPDLVLRILGEGDGRADFERLAFDLGVADRVVFRGFRPWLDAMVEIRQAELGIVAIIPDGYGELLLPTKLLEYADHEVPVACARLPVISHYFPEDSLAYFEPGDPAGLATQINRLLLDRRAARTQALRARKAMRNLSWQALAPNYIAALGLKDLGVAAVTAT